MLNSISPIDGRYASKTSSLRQYFSEYALIRYRVLVEIEYIKFLASKKIGILKAFPQTGYQYLDNIIENFTEQEAQQVKSIEKTVNHDVKAVEYYIKNKIEKKQELKPFKEFVHFGLTSQDINNTAFPMMLKDALNNEIIPHYVQIVNRIVQKANEYKGIPMLARTHGQPASPTTLGKEFEVFVERLQTQLNILKNIVIYAKFGGATGNLNAHKVSFPDVDWLIFADQFVSQRLGMTRSKKTTQIAHYDDIANVLQACQRINTVLIDMCRDIWTYISMDYFTQRTIKSEIGSSAMPHKVNPIDFENAEGNLGMATAICTHLSNTLPISRLQRDLTDSTVLRNIGVPFGHILIACKSIDKGLNKIVVNKSKLNADLDANWAVVAEAIQNILRRESYPNPYETLKNLTRGNNKIDKASIHNFIHSLLISEDLKSELLAITPFNYTGYY